MSAETSSLFSFVQTGTRSRPWHVVGGPGIVKSPLDVTACGERGSVVNNAHGELPRFAKLCEKCEIILAAAERELPPADLWSALHKIAYSRGGQYELISTLRNVAREAIEARTPDATPPRATDA